MIATLEDFVENEDLIEIHRINIPKREYMEYPLISELSKFLDDYLDLVFDLVGIEGIELHCFETLTHHPNTDNSSDLFYPDSYRVMIRDTNKSKRSTFIQKYNGNYLLVWHEIEKKINITSDKLFVGGRIEVTTYRKETDNHGNPILEQIGNPEIFENDNNLLKAKSEAAKYFDLLVKYHDAELGKCEIPFLKRDPTDSSRFYIEHDPNNINYLFDYTVLPRCYLTGFQDTHLRTLNSLQVLKEKNEISDIEYRAAKTLLNINRHRYEAAQKHLLFCKD
ncbi:MAG: hypothetical protein ACMXYG_01825 [Candidatus Woesearchaeota archaeon]